jgi:hypothetical protein
LAHTKSSRRSVPEGPPSFARAETGANYGEVSPKPSTGNANDRNRLRPYEIASNSAKAAWARSIARGIHVSIAPLPSRCFPTLAVDPHFRERFDPEAFSANLVQAGLAIARQQYVASPDGQRFLADTIEQPLASQMTLLLNWSGR